MFAISGALVAVRRNLDIFGVLVLAGTTGLGGGFLRDVLIGATPPAALADWRYLHRPGVGGAAHLRLPPGWSAGSSGWSSSSTPSGIALFCVTGALKALEYGLEPVPAALMGLVTAIGGGIARDLLAGRVPEVFRGELYASPALAGAAVVVVLDQLGQPTIIVAVAGAGVPGLAVSLRLHWRAPMPAGPANV